MALEKKTFAMSMFCNSNDLYKAKAEYFEEQADRLNEELQESRETTAYLERCLYAATQELDNLTGGKVKKGDLLPDE